MARAKAAPSEAAFGTARSIGSGDSKDQART